MAGRWSAAPSTPNRWLPGFGLVVADQAENQKLETITFSIKYTFNSKRKTNTPFIHIYRKKVNIP